MTGGDAARWQAAKQLRAEHPRWLVIWVACTQRYHAYLLAASRAGASELTDTEAAGLAAQMQQAQRAAAGRTGQPARLPPVPRASLCSPFKTSRSETPAMPAVPNPGAAALSDEFPGWTLWVSGTDRL
jgi:hypothetical protein